MEIQIDAGGLWLNAGEVDACEVDANEINAGEIGAGEIDSGELDTGRLDTGRLDAGRLDAGRLHADGPGISTVLGRVRSTFIALFSPRASWSQEANRQLIVLCTTAILHSVVFDVPGDHCACETSYHKLAAVSGRRVKELWACQRAAQLSLRWGLTGEASLSWKSLVSRLHLASCMNTLALRWTKMCRDELI